MPRIGLSLLICMAVMLSWTPLATATPFFGKVFFKEHIKDHKDKEYVDFVKKKAKCFVCHQGKKKKHHNPFGVHLVDLLDKKKDKKNEKKVIEALKKVLAMHSDPKDKKSSTYLELIKKSKLPGGKLEDLKKEPKKKEKSEDSKEKDSKEKGSKEKESDSKEGETATKKDSASDSASESTSKESETDSKEEKSESKKEEKTDSKDKESESEKEEKTESKDKKKEE